MTNIDDIATKLKQIIDERKGSMKPLQRSFINHVKEQVMAALNLAPPGLYLSANEIAKIIDASHSRISSALRELRAVGTVESDPATNGHRLVRVANASKPVQAPVAKPVSKSKAPMKVQKTKVKMPSIRDLTRKLRKQTVAQTARELGISKQSLTRYCDRRGIQRNPGGRYIQTTQKAA